MNEADQFAFFALGYFKLSWLAGDDLICMHYYRANQTCSLVPYHSHLLRYSPIALICIRPSFVGNGPATYEEEGS